jgi:PAS domain S-box-containing protein
MTTAGIARVGQMLCLVGAALGAIGVYGWLSGTGVGTVLMPGLPPMTPNTALGLLLTGAAGAARREAAHRIQRNLSLLAAFVVLALAVATLAEYGLGLDLHIDRLLVSSQPVASVVRPSPSTAWALALLAVALLVFDTGPTLRVRPSEWLALCAALLAFTGLTGIILGAAPLYRLTHAPIIGLGLPTALSLILTSTGLLLERPAAGFMRVATSPGPGGVLLRSLTLPIVVVPVVLGFAMTHIPALRAVDVSIPIAILAAALTAGGLLVLVVTAMPLDRAHAQLVASRAQTQSLFEQAPEGIFVADLDGHYTDVNDAGCRILGHSREEILGKTIVDLLLAEDVPRLWEAKESLLGGAIQVAEWRLRRKDGTYVPVEVSTRILPDGRWQGFVRDISERKRLEEQRTRLEEELRLAEAKSSGIISISADAIISIDAEQQITLFNEGAEKIFGYSKAEAIGSRLDILIPERHRAAHREHVSAFAASPAATRRMGGHGVTIVGRRKTGEEFPADAAISTFDVSGARVLSVVLRDVTEQKRIENEQRFLAAIGPALSGTLDYEETLSRIAEIPVGGLSDFCIVDLVDGTDAIRRVRVAGPSDGPHGRIRDVLERAPLDQRRGDLVRTVLESQQPALGPLALPTDLEASVMNDEACRVLKAAERHSVIVAPLVAHGRVRGAMSFLSVTPSRAFDQHDVRVANQFAERAALAVENAQLYSAAQRAIQTREEVLGVVAHDLRNPLSAILIEVELLRRAATLDSEARESVEAIKTSGTRINRLIAELLDVTRLEAGRLVLETRRLSATQAATDACELCRTLASSHHVALRLSMPRELPDVWADRDRLLQVFENLIGNSVKFAPPGSSVTIGAASQETDVLFWVADSGPGISLEHQAHLFDRFWQAHTAGRNGAGLGLAIVKGIVDAHNGRVWVDSAPGQGSTFFFTIPTAEQVTHAIGDQSKVDPPLPGR